MGIQTSWSLIRKSRNGFVANLERGGDRLDPVYKVAIQLMVFTCSKPLSSLKDVAGAALGIGSSSGLGVSFFRLKNRENIVFAGIDCF